MENVYTYYGITPLRTSKFHTFFQYLVSSIVGWEKEIEEYWIKGFLTMLVIFLANWLLCPKFEKMPFLRDIFFLE
jgi:hypothetical protein